MEQEVQVLEFTKRFQVLLPAVSIAHDFLAQDAQVFQAHTRRYFTRALIYDNHNKIDKWQKRSVDGVLNENHSIGLMGMTSAQFILYSPLRLNYMNR
jgi:hypothetical protein